MSCIAGALQEGAVARQREGSSRIGLICDRTCSVGVSGQLPGSNRLEKLTSLHIYGIAG